MAWKTFCKYVATVPLPSSPPLPFPHLRSRPLITGRGLVELSSPSGSGRSPAAKRYLVNFRLKISHLVATISRSFSGNETPNWGTGWPSGNILCAYKLFWTYDTTIAWKTFCKYVATVPPLPSPFPSLPLEVGPLIAGRASGVRFSSPRGSGRSPAAKRYLVNLASGSNNLQELFRKWTGGTRWPSGNILVQTNCLDITMACMEDVLQGCGDACGSFCTAYYFFAWALGEAVVPPSSPSLNWRPWVTLVSWVCYS